MKRSRPRPKRKGSVRSLKKKLWLLFADYIKERDGRVCFTCDKPVFGRDCQAGHFVSCAKEFTRFDPENVHVQCRHENVFMKGNIPEYARRYLDRYGREKFDALMARSDRMRQWKPYQLEELIAALKIGGAEYEMLYAERYSS